jgi:hypothetical protein
MPFADALSLQKQGGGGGAGGGGGGGGGGMGGGAYNQGSYGGSNYAGYSGADPNATSSAQVRIPYHRTSGMAPSMCDARLRAENVCFEHCLQQCALCHATINSHADCVKCSQVWACLMFGTSVSGPLPNTTQFPASN